MSFYQDENTLFIIGGYGFSTSANDHVTFANLTSIDVPGVINAIVSGTSISGYFKQITNNNLAITGGQLGKMGGPIIWWEDNNLMEDTTQWACQPTRKVIPIKFENSAFKIRSIH